MLYTGKGDDGKTRLFGCDQRLSKSATIAEALGTVDEVNALLGVVKMSHNESSISSLSFPQLINEVQHDLFVVQAQLAGSEKRVTNDMVIRVESWLKEIDDELPPITTFFVSGGTQVGALCDHARTVVRRAERWVIRVEEEAIDLGEVPRTSPPLLAYMNRLSSLLYGLARLLNHRSGIVEEKPHY